MGAKLQFLITKDQEQKANIFDNKRDCLFGQSLLLRI